jgi:biotin synthase
VLTALAKAAKLGKIRRICIQALNYPDVFLQIEALVSVIKKSSEIPVSVSCQPLNVQNIELLKKCGVDRIGIALDASTKKLFSEVKGSGTGSTYNWENQFTQMSNAVCFFGKGNVSTHVIVGLGETEKEATEVIQTCFDMTVLPGLFAFTPVRGTALEAKAPPKLDSYRRIQLARYIIVNGKAKSSDMNFDNEGRITSFGVPKEVLESMVESGLPFRTSGCLDCNRPFYNEKPSGPIYNYPKQPSQVEIKEIRTQLRY